MTAYAFGADDTWFAVFSEGDRLVTAVHAGDIATAAAYAFLVVNHGEYHRVAVKVGRQNKVLEFFAD